MKHLPRISALTAGGALALGLLAAPAAQAAGASSGSTSASAKGTALTVVKSLAAARITGRIATLQALQLAVSDSAKLTSSDKSALSTLLSSDLSGLQALNTKISGETTVAAVRADEVVMVDDYRVYLLVAPKTHLSIVFDDEADVITKLQSVYSALSADLGKAGGGTSTEQSELADMQSQINAAQTALNGEESTLLAIQPGADASTITGQLQPLRASAKSVRKDLGQAVTDARAVRAALG